MNEPVRFDHSDKGDIRTIPVIGYEIPTPSSSTSFENPIPSTSFENSISSTIFGNPISSTSFEYPIPSTSCANHIRRTSSREKILLPRKGLLKKCF